MHSRILMAAGIVSATLGAACSSPKTDDTDAYEPTGACVERHETSWEIYGNPRDRCEESRPYILITESFCLSTAEANAPAYSYHFYVGQTCMQLGYSIECHNEWFSASDIAASGGMSVVCPGAAPDAGGGSTRCGGTGDTCQNASCCAGSVCCGGAFCGGNCIGTPCCR